MAQVILLLISLILLLNLPQETKAQSSASAPSPASASGSINITAILEKAGQYNTLIKFLNTTQVGNQIDIQVNNSNDGMTVFAPTDNAFNNLPPGTLNKLSDQQKVLLIQYHVLPKFYSLDDLQTVSNPVRTQANGPDGKTYGLNFTGQNNQVNVTTGAVETQIYNALRKDPPLAVYQVDKVLLPLDFTDKKGSAASSPPDSDNGTTVSSAKEPSPAPNAADGKIVMSFGLGVMFLCMWFL